MTPREDVGRVPQSGLRARPSRRGALPDDPPRLAGRDQRRLLFVIALCLAAGLFLLLVVEPAQARPPVPAPVFSAVRAHWTVRAERIKAFDVIACETGGTYSTRASNGQYLGIFQMGAWARARYGHGSSARAQAAAAHRYWRVAGWAPWTCA